MASNFRDERPALTIDEVGAILDKVPALRDAWDEAKASGSTESKIRVTCPNPECSQRPEEKSDCTVTLDEDFIWCFKCKFGGRLDTAAAKLLGVKTIALLADIGADHLTSNEHYTVLGFKNDSNCTAMAVLRNRTGTVTVVRISGERARLRDVASEEVFARVFYPNMSDDKREKLNFTGEMGRRIVDAFEGRCMELRELGVEHGMENLRGRGAALIGGEPVYNLGAHVLKADGTMGVFETDHIRVLQPGKMITDLPSREAASAYDPERFRRLFGLIAGHYPLSDCGAEFLIGWVANSLVSGLHKVNPNVSFTGVSGGGKSWLVDEIFRRILGGDYSGIISKNSSHAGVRRLIGNSSTGLFFDEAEASKANWGNVDWILDLMRQMATGNAVIHLAVKDNLHGYEEFRPSAPVMIISNIEADMSRMPDARRLLRVVLREGRVENFDDTLGRELTELAQEPDFADQWRSHMLFGMRRILELTKSLRRHLGKHGHPASVVDMVAPIVSALAHSMDWGEEEMTECANRCAAAFSAGVAENARRDWEMVLTELLRLNTMEGRQDASGITAGAILCQLDTGKRADGEDATGLETSNGSALGNMGMALVRGELRVRYTDVGLRDRLKSGNAKTLLQSEEIRLTRHDNMQAAGVPSAVWRRYLEPYLRECHYGKSQPEPAQRYDESDIPI